MIATQQKGFYTAYPLSGIPTFLRSKELRTLDEVDTTNFDISFLGVPFDEGMPYLPGSRFCARGMREQSLRYNKRGYYDVDEDKVYLAKELQEDRMVDLGDVPIVPCDVEGNVRLTSEIVRRVLRKDNHPLLVGLGGDHSVSNPLIQGFDVLQEPIHVVQFDSHPDYAEFSDGFTLTNAHPFRHVAGMDHVKSLTQVGIRSVRAFNARDSRADGNRIVGMREFRRLGPSGIASLLPEREACYISIDIDALDCSLVPGCPSAEPNGMMFAELTDTLAAIAAHNRIVGFDLVEVAPELDVGNKITSYLATMIVVLLLGKICDQPYWKARYLPD